MKRDMNMEMAETVQLTKEQDIKLSNYLYVLVEKFRVL